MLRIPYHAIPRPGHSMMRSSTRVRSYIKPTTVRMDRSMSAFTGMAFFSSSVHARTHARTHAAPRRASHLTPCNENPCKQTQRNATHRAAWRRALVATPRVRAHTRKRTHALLHGRTDDPVTPSSVIASPSELRSACCACMRRRRPLDLHTHAYTHADTHVCTHVYTRVRTQAAAAGLARAGSA